MGSKENERRGRSVGGKYGMKKTEEGRQGKENTGKQESRQKEKKRGKKILDYIQRITNKHAS